MLPIDKIRNLLQDIQIGKVTAATGLHYSTIRDLRDNPDANPSYRTVKAVSDYLEARDHG